MSWNYSYIWPYISRYFYSLTIAIAFCVYIPVLTDIPEHYADDVCCNEWTPLPNSSPQPGCPDSTWFRCSPVLSSSRSFLLFRWFPGCSPLLCMAQDSTLWRTANFRVSCAVYAEPLSVSHCTGMSGNLYATITVTRHVTDDIEDVRLYPCVNFVITPGTASALSDGWMVTMLVGYVGDIHTPTPSSAG